MSYLQNFNFAWGVGIFRCEERSEIWQFLGRFRNSLEWAERKIESCAYSGEDERLPTAELRNCVHIGTEYAPAIRSELNHIFPVFPLLHSFTHTHKHREASP